MSHINQTCDVAIPSKALSLPENRCNKDERDTDSHVNQASPETRMSLAQCADTNEANHVRRRHVTFHSLLHDFSHPHSLLHDFSHPHTACAQSALLQLPSSYSPTPTLHPPPFRHPPLSRAPQHSAFENRNCESC